MSGFMHKPNNWWGVIVGIGLTSAAFGIKFEKPFTQYILMVGLLAVLLPFWLLLDTILKEIRHTNRVGEQSRKTNRDEECG